MSSTTPKSSNIDWTPWTPEQREAESVAHDGSAEQRVLLVAGIANAHQGRVHSRRTDYAYEQATPWHTRVAPAILNESV